MRATALAGNTARYGRFSVDTSPDIQSTSIPAPIGGWDAMSPLAAMPPQNAVELVNFFPQPGYVEVRKGFINWCDLGTAEPVETVMGYQGFNALLSGLFAVSDGDVWDVTTFNVPVITSITGLGSNRIQKTMFNNGTVDVLWCCNGEDDPFYYNGTAWVVTAITGSFTASDIINVVSYRNRLWGVLKNSTKGVFLGLNAITGAATVFDVGAQFPRGGFLMAIGTWSTDTQNGPNEFISFISSYGDVAVYQISDPTTPTGISYLGTSSMGAPIGRRCFSRIGADLALITIDGVIPLSQVLAYDRAAIQSKAITSTIRTAMTAAAQRQKDYFGWQLISYPRNTMAILNVPIAENAQQEQFVMNTVTGAWCRFQGQYANCWDTWNDRAFFGNNDGLVCLADEAAGDEDQTLEASMRGAFNFYGAPGNIKQWEMILPLVTINSAYPVNPSIGLNVDFEENAILDPIDFTDESTVALWNDPTNAIWNVSLWPGDTTTSAWATINGVGRYASIRMAISIPWDTTLLAAQTLKVNSFTVLYSIGGWI